MLIVKDCKTVWNNCLLIIKEEVGDQIAKTWFEPIIPVTLQGDVLTLQVPSRFFYEWLEDNYVHVLRKAIDMELGPEGRLEYTIVVDNQETFKTSGFNITKGQVHPSKSSPSKNAETKEPAPITFNPNLDVTHTFDSFIEGDCNRLARSAGLAVAERPGTTSFNPLMIYGGVGLGKTHLVQAIGNEIRKNAPEKKILYLDAQNFTSQFIEYLKNNNTQEFINQFFQVDVLVLDDIQFLSNKEKTQEIFFHIFNHLHQQKKQIIMTSDCPPKDLTGLQERLVSRFKWGLTADLQHPDFETKVAIIQKKMQRESVKISDTVVEYLAYSVDTNIRDLEGVIITLIAQSSLNRKEIDLDLAKQVLQNNVKSIESEVGVDYIQKFVAEYFGVTVDSLKAKTRKREFVVARQVAMYFTKQYTTLSLKTIGNHFGNRDHSTVIHALNSVNDLMDTDRKFNATMQDLTKKLKLKTV